MKDLVSIAIVTYNQASFIQETLDSALKQDYEPLEVVVADDGSSDGTDEIIRSYDSQNPGRLVALTGGPNLGITGNSNRALKACKGKYIAFQGGDDIILPGKIRKQVEWFESDSERVLCGHDVEIFDSSSGTTLANWSDVHPMTSGQGAGWIIRNGVPFAAISVMVRRTALPSFGFDQRVPMVSDWKLWIDCLSSGGKYGYIEGIYARYRRSDKNISRNTRIMVQDRLVTLSLIESTMPQFLAACATQRSRAYYDLGIANMKEGKYAEARALLKAAFWISGIRQPKLPVALLFTLLPIRWSQPLLADRATPRKFADYLDLIFKA